MIAELQLNQQKAGNTAYFQLKPVIQLPMLPEVFLEKPAINLTETSEHT